VNIVELTEEDAQQRLAMSTSLLLHERPDLSAAGTVTAYQRRGLIGLLILAAIGLVVLNHATAIVLVAMATALYSAVIINRVALFMRSLGEPALERVSDVEARAIPDALLPVVTVLVPAYREPEIISHIVSAVGALEYPRDKLDFKLLLEADDDDTLAAIHASALTAHVEVVLVPPGAPRTKPKALNYGLTLARGSFVCIYDAEDRPDPLQLRKAAVVFARSDPNVVCVQAKLDYFNATQNLITRWFTLEYAMWFSFLLPGLVVTDAPVPLGGTSNHFRRKELEDLLAWDPYNVTEDADLGIRLRRRGYRCRVLDSVTYEEANSDFLNWMKQRSRWYKGYLQTWLIHMRHPVTLRRELGTVAFVQFTLFVGGTPFLAIINPIFWSSTLVWLIGHPHFIVAIFPAPVFYAALVCWAIGNFVILYLTIITTRESNRPRLLVAALLVPAYWIMMSVAAIKALVQLIFTPSYWEKTTHGLDRLAG